MSAIKTFFPDFFIKKKPELPDSDKHIRVDHGEGTVTIPGKETLPLVGLDSEWRRLKSKDEEMADFNARVAERMAKRYKCADCKRTISGKLAHPGLIRGINFNPNDPAELDLDRLRCLKCGGALVEVRK